MVMLLPMAKMRLAPSLCRIPRFNSFYFVFFSVASVSVPLGVGVSTLFRCLSLLQQLRDLKKKTSSVSSEGGGDDDNALSW